MLKFLKKLISPFSVLSQEGAFFLWFFFVPACGLASAISYYLNDNFEQVFLDGTFYTYSIGILMPLIFDTLISFIISKRLNKQEDMVQVKIVYVIIAILIVFFSGFAYDSKSKASRSIQLWTFVIASAIASLLYFSMQMSRFNNLKKKYDDQGYEDEEKAKIDVLEQSVTKDTLKDKDGVVI